MNKGTKEGIYSREVREVEQAGLGDGLDVEKTKIREGTGISGWSKWVDNVRQN